MTATRQPVSFLATHAPDLAEPFYRDVLGLKLKETSPYALVFEDGDHPLRIQIVQGFKPAPHTVYGWQVPDMSAEVKALQAKGISLVSFDHLDQDATGIWTTPQGHKIAWFKDPSGNILSLTQYV